ncbi:MAG: hypothetical protein MRZ79_01445 [Bacteroidia bacterium]|nr:hypothetical protein [Bacteroidia bacterium]
MRRITIFILLFTLCSVLMAQRKERSFFSQYAQGKTLVGASLGSTGFASVFDGSFYLPNASRLNAQGRLGYFVQDQLLVGLSIGRNIDINYPFATYTPIRTEVFSRYYFTGDRLVNFFGEAGAGISYANPIRNSDGQLLFGGLNPHAHVEIGASLPIRNRTTIDIGTQLDFNSSKSDTRPTFRTIGWTPFKLGLNYSF